jgi:excisionase family DNA binding protein
VYSECTEYRPSQAFTNSKNYRTAEGPHPAGDLHPVTTGTAISTQRDAPVLRTAAASGSPKASPRGQDGSQGSLLSVRAVAARLGVSTATVYKGVAEGTLLHVRVSNAIRIAPTDVDVFVACQGFGTATRQQHRPDELLELSVELPQTASVPGDGRSRPPFPARHVTRHY